jgi:hypothetical protein
MLHSLDLGPICWRAHNFWQKCVEHASCNILFETPSTGDADLVLENSPILCELVSNPHGQAHSPTRHCGLPIRLTVVVVAERNMQPKPDKNPGITLGLASGCPWDGNEVEYAAAGLEERA